MPLCVLAFLDSLQHPPGVTQHHLPTFCIPVTHPQRVAAAVGDSPYWLDISALPLQSPTSPSQQRGRPAEHSCKVHRSTILSDNNPIS
jgi:hypothetical protein